MGTSLTALPSTRPSTLGQAHHPGRALRQGSLQPSWWHAHDGSESPRGTLATDSLEYFMRTSVFGRHDVFNAAERNVTGAPTGSPHTGLCNFKRLRVLRYRQAPQIQRRLFQIDVGPFVVRSWRHHGGRGGVTSSPGSCSTARTAQQRRKVVSQNKNQIIFVINMEFRAGVVTSRVGPGLLPWNAPAERVAGPPEAQRVHMCTMGTQEQHRQDRSNTSSSLNCAA